MLKQHNFGRNTKTKNFSGPDKKEESLPPTANSLDSREGKTQLSTFKETRENASRGIYLLHELPQTSTKDYGS